MSCLSAIILLMFCSELYAPLPTSRNSDRAEQLTPHTVIITSLMYHMTELLSTIEAYLVGFQKKAFLDTVNALDSISVDIDTSSDKLCEILNILAYESSYTGGLPIFNLGGPNHNNTDSMGNVIVPAVLYWDYPLIISDSDPKFKDVNVIKFQDNIVFKPNSMGLCPNPSVPAAAIIVQKDNMTIDLSGFSLILDDSLLTPAYDQDLCPSSSDCSTPPSCLINVHGIIIAPGVKNTQIVSSAYQNSSTHSAIKDFTGYGIYAQGTTTAGQKVENVTIHDIHINDCFGGILAEHTNDMKVLRCQTNNNCSFNPVYGMKYVDVTNLTITESESSSNDSCGDVWGIYMEDTNNTLVQNSQISMNKSHNDGSAYGIHITATSPTSSSTNHIKNCMINKNTCSSAITAQANGILLTSTNPALFSGTAHAKIEGCSILNNGVSGSSQPPVGYGIQIHGSNYNEINKNKVGLNATTGIYDTFQTFPNGSTSLFTSNVAFFNGTAGTPNYSIKFTKNLTGALEDFRATILYAANLQGINTTDVTLGNLDIRKI